TYQFIDRLFTRTGWSSVGTAASGTAVTSKGQARPGKSASDSSTTGRERRQASGTASEATRRDEGTRRDDSARGHESARRGKGAKDSRGPRTCDRGRNERFRSTDR